MAEILENDWEALAWRSLFCFFYVEIYFGIEMNTDDKVK